MKPKLLMVTFLTLILSAFPSCLLAELEGNPCSPEPTDDSMFYGDLITCDIGSIGDSDLFRFIGESGEKIIIQTAQGGSGSTPDPCIELFGPDEIKIGVETCHEVAARKVVDLDQSGQFTIRVTEWGNDQTMNYVLVLERILPPSPSAMPISAGIPKEGAIRAEALQ